jgi:hypothetical protein
VQVGDGKGLHELPLSGAGADLGVAVAEPLRKSGVAELGILEGPGPADHVELHLLTELQESGQIPLGNVAKAEVPLRRLVQAPGDIGGNTVAAGFPEQLKAALPVLPGHPEVVELP